jgi:thioredoxin 1
MTISLAKVALLKAWNQRAEAAHHRSRIQKAGAPVLGVLPQGPADPTCCVPPVVARPRGFTTDSTAARSAMGAHTVDVTDATFEAEVLNSELPVLVDFWAVWCGPCRMIAPVLDQLAAEYDGRIKVAKVDVDKSGMTAGRFGVRSIPTVLLMKGGAVVETLVGAQPKSNFEDAVRRHL